MDLNSHLKVKLRQMKQLATKRLKALLEVELENTRLREQIAQLKHERDQLIERLARIEGKR